MRSMEGTYFNLCSPRKKGWKSLWESKVKISIYRQKIIISYLNRFPQALLYPVSLGLSDSKKRSPFDKGASFSPGFHIGMQRRKLTAGAIQYTKSLSPCNFTKLFVRAGEGKAWAFRISLYRHFLLRDGVQIKFQRLTWGTPAFFIIIICVPCQLSHLLGKVLRCRLLVDIHRTIGRVWECLSAYFMTAADLIISCLLINSVPLQMPLNRRKHKPCFSIVP